MTLKLNPAKPAIYTSFLRYNLPDVIDIELIAILSNVLLMKTAINGSKNIESIPEIHVSIWN